MNLTEQLDQLRDGDIARAEFKGIATTAIEGVVSTDSGTTSVGGYSVRWPAKYRDDLTSVTILRPVLQPGDRVRWRGAISVVYEVATDDVRIDSRHNNGGWVKITDCERLPAESAPQPTVEVGQWWEFRGTPRVIVAVLGVVIRFRRWDTEEVNNSTEDEVRADWTRLDGPPEPPVGSVITYRLNANIPGNMLAFRYPDGFWYHTNDHGGETWDGLVAYADTASLRVLAVLDRA